MSLSSRRAGSGYMMPRPIRVAMVISVAIHMVGFVIADWLLRGQTQPSARNAPLLVSFASPSADGDVADDKVVVPESSGQAPDQDSNRQARVASKEISEPVEATEMVVAEEFLAEELNEPAAFAPLLRDSLNGPMTPTDAAPAIEEITVPASVVTTVGNSESPQVVPVVIPEPPEPVHASLLPKQEKMLNKKVRQWSENLYRMPEAASGLTWKHKGQEYLATFTALSDPGETGIERVIVEISTEQDGKRLTTEVYLKRLAFSNYAQFVNRWDPDVQIHDDEMDGRFHSNTEINLTYDRKVKPLFHGKVTTTSRSVNVMNTRGFTRRSEIFTGGLQTGVRSIRLPKHFVPFPEKSEVSEEQLRRFSEDTRIVFHEDGSFAWHPVDSTSAQQVEEIAEATTYLIAEARVKLYVKGTINGKVLVYSPERIIIEDDLIYEQDPEEIFGSDDYLGLVSDKYVDIASPEVTGPGDLVINAAIYAKRRFTVRNYGSRETALLYLYGSLTVGSLSATEPRYATKIHFDRRLEDMRPPGFPMTDRYEVESWDAVWEVEPIEEELPSGHVL
jgi:hypothetical protein